jgi:hypothetical protein
MFHNFFTLVKTGPFSVSERTLIRWGGRGGGMGGGLDKYE